MIRRELLRSAVRVRPAQVRTRLRDWITMREYWAHNKRLADAQHQQAVSVLTECAQTGGPFILFLRNFDLSAYSMARKDKVWGPVVERQRAYHDVIVGFEDRLVNALSSYAPVIRLSNPEFTSTFMPTKAHTLLLSARSWQTTLKSLVRAANVIVMFLDNLTPGVDRELFFIRLFNRVDDTVLVLQEEEDSFAANLAKIYPWMQPPSKQELARIKESIRDFPRVVRADEKLLKDLSFSVFDLLPPAHRRNLHPRRNNPSEQFLATSSTKIP